jgi:hypothetical protein
MTQFGLSPVIPLLSADLDRGGWESQLEIRRPLSRPK